MKILGHAVAEAAGVYGEWWRPITGFALTKEGAAKAEEYLRTTEGRNVKAVVLIAAEDFEVD